MWKMLVVSMGITGAAVAQPAADTDSVLEAFPLSPHAVEDTIRATATDSLVIVFSGRHLRLYGNATAHYRRMAARGGVLHYEWSHQKLWVLPSADSATVEFRDGEAAYRARWMMYHFPSKRAFMEELRFAEGEGFIHSYRVAKDSLDRIYGERALYTTCDADTPHYAIAAQKIKLIPQKYLISGPAVLTLAGVPTLLAIPFGFFPIPKRQASGIILPAYGESDTRGFFLRDGGIFIALNDYVDIALTGDIYSFGSWAARFRSRYKLRYRFGGEVGFAYAYNIFGLPESPDRDISKDFWFRWSHRKERAANPFFDFSADVNITSGNYFRLNSYENQQIVTNTLQSSIHFRRQFGGGRHVLSTALNHSQNTSNHQMTFALPHITYSVRRIYPFKRWRKAPAWLRKMGTHYQWQWRTQWETTDSTFLLFRWGDEARYGAVHQIPFSTSFKLFRYLNVSPSFRYRGFFNFYETERIPIGDTVITRRKAAFRYVHDFNYSMALTTRLYGFLYLRVGRLQVIRHTVQPVVSLSSSPDFSAPPWNYFRYYLTPEGDSVRYYPYETLLGMPSGRRSGVLNFSVNNVFEAKFRTDDTSASTERRVLIDNLSVGGRYDMAADSFGLSPLTAAVRLRRGPLGIQGTATLDPYAYDSTRRLPKYAWEAGQGMGHLTRLSLSLNHSMRTPDDWPIQGQISAGYTATSSYYPGGSRRTSHILNARGDIRPTPKWRISISSGYDFTNRQPTFTTIQVYRDLHCWEMSLQIIPFGFRKSYHFRINVKASTLRDLKIEKRKDYFDFIR